LLQTIIDEDEIMIDEASCVTKSHSQLAGTAKVPEELEGLLARDVMQVGVVSIDRKETVQKAVAMLIEHNISGLPVAYQGHLEGMLSEKDLLRLLYEGQYLPGLVEDYMTCHVTSFDVEDKVSMIYPHLTLHSFRRVPILYHSRLAGMVTRADLVRVLLERLRPSCNATDSSGKSQLLAEDAMKAGLLTVFPDAPLYKAMDLIARHHVTGLPVVDEGMNLLGVITEKDILDSVSDQTALDVPVEVFMTRKVTTFGRRASLYDICACLIDNDFHRVPIVDGTRLVGIISRSDILKHRAAVFKC
jgi:CBS domain-containing protein